LTFGVPGFLQYDPSYVAASSVSWISRKTSLFLGSVEQARGASLCYSLMECCRLHGVNQFEYMNDVLKIIETYPKEKLPELLPHNWKKARGNNKAPS